MLMRVLIFVLTISTSSIAFCSYPKPVREYVNDFASIISGDLESDIDGRLYKTEYYSGVEIAVVTITSFKSYNTGDESWESFSTGLFNNWRIGNLPANDGVLFLISKNDRKVRIELGAGYPSHYDAVMKNIIETVIVPELKIDNYSDGIRNGVESIIEAVTVQVSFFEWYKYHILICLMALFSTAIALYAEKHDKRGFFWFFLSIAGFLVLGLLSGLRNGNRSDGFGGGSSSGGGASGSF